MIVSSFNFQAMKAFIEANFKMIDIDGDGIVGAKEYRYNCITRIAVDNIDIVNEAFEKLLDVSKINLIQIRREFTLLFVSNSFLDRTRIVDAVAWLWHGTKNCTAIT